MKTYIENKITISKDLLLKDWNTESVTKEAAWEYYVREFTLFRQAYVIFSTILEDKIVISEQKIVLDEENMAQFLYEMEDIAYYIHSIKIKYQAESHRIIVNIKQGETENT